MNSSLQARFARWPHERLRRFVPALREGLVGADVTRTKLAVSGRGDEILGAKTLRVQLILDKDFPRKVQDADRSHTIATQIDRGPYLQPLVPSQSQSGPV